MIFSTLQFQIPIYDISAFMPDTGGILEVNQTQTLSLRSSESSRREKMKKKDQDVNLRSNIKGVSIKTLDVPMRHRGDTGSSGDGL